MVNQSMQGALHKRNDINIIYTWSIKREGLLVCCIEQYYYCYIIIAKKNTFSTFSIYWCHGNVVKRSCNLLFYNHRSYRGGIGHITFATTCSIYYLYFICISMILWLYTVCTCFYIWYHYTKGVSSTYPFDYTIRVCYLLIPPCY